MARLKGHEFDLLTLAELFGVPDDLFRDGGGLHDAASVLLRRVNGVARTLSSDVRPVGLTGRLGTTMTRAPPGCSTARSGS
jgi:hypothetical protein